MNQKIVDKIDEIKTLQVEYKNLRQLKEQEEESVHKKLVFTLREQGLVHITCNHETVMTPIVQNEEFDLPTKCTNCKNNVEFKYGVYLTEDELKTIYRIYGDTPKVNELKQKLHAKEKEFEVLKQDVINIVADNLRKAGLMSKCKHEKVKSTYEQCKICGEWVSLENGVHVLSGGLNTKEKDLLENTLNSLPIKFQGTWARELEYCFKESA